MTFLTPKTEMRHDLTLNASLLSVRRCNLHNIKLAQHKPHGDGRSLQQSFTVKRGFWEGYGKDSV
ncbi:unnamed protein product [Brassica napus]|uniref:(rape) hypothetical protein n=1 Tax=Brassica napus TaxID=3708 RepID=A0A816YS11_BRANA|nr:unnamed protein product [Brassica napus]